MEGMGRQLILECWDCNENIFSSSAVREALQEAVRKAEVTLLEFVVHDFQPYGVSAVAVISESHIFIHTWPEKRYLAMDAFTCGTKAMPERAVEVVKQFFQPRRIKSYELVRGSWP